MASNGILGICLAANAVLSLPLLAAEPRAETPGGNPQTGRALYDRDCAKCHGKSGDGNGAMGKSMSPKPTAFTDKALMAKVTDDQLFETTRKGGSAVGLSETMPAFPKYSDQQIRNLVAYLRTFAR